MPLNKSQFTETARRRFREASDFWHNWRVAAIDDYAFVSGNQWLPEDEAILKSQKRPPITFNYSEKMIDAVVGAEVSNRNEVSYRPRNVEASGLAELWTDAAQWAREECNAEDEESDAFRDMLICGMGWTQTRMSYDEDQDGKIVIDRIDPLEMYSDPAASKPGLIDRRYQFRIWWVDKRDAMREWPSQIQFASDDLDNRDIGVITRGHRYENGEEDEKDRHKDQVQIRHYECVEREPIWRIATEGGIIELPAEEFTKMRDQLDTAQIQYAKQYKRVYYRAFFAGDTLLEVGLSPCQDGFTFQAITGKRDRNKNTFYGLTRVMKDPQRWANKWLSQILHIVNTNAKGGLMAEIGAFVDPTKAADEWAQPDSITMFNEGALSGGKVQPKQTTPYPSGLDRLMEFALSSLPMVTGINLEALGLANREQAGILEQQRKQAAYGLLAPLFDSLRRYRKTQGRILLFFIHEFISDGRLIRIGGVDSQQFLPLAKQDKAPEYDIIVDQSPNAPDVKDKTWQTLVQLVPNMLKAGMPLPPDLLDYSPLPAALATKWKQFAQQQKQPDPQMQQQLQQMQQQLQQLQQENISLKQDQSLDQAQLAQKGQQIQAELQLKHSAQEAEINLRQAQAIADFNLKKLTQEQDFELEQRRLAHESDIKHRSMQNDFKVKAMAAGLKPKPGEDGQSKLAITMDTDQLSSAVKEMATSNSHLSEAANQSNKAILKAMENLTAALSRPRKLIEDKNGKPIGSTPA